MGYEIYSLLRRAALTSWGFGVSIGADESSEFGEVASIVNPVEESRDGCEILFAGEMLRGGVRRLGAVLTLSLPKNRKIRLRTITRPILP